MIEAMISTIILFFIFSLLYVAVLIDGAKQGHLDQTVQGYLTRVSYIFTVGGDRFLVNQKVCKTETQITSVEFF